MSEEGFKALKAASDRVIEEMVDPPNLKWIGEEDTAEERIVPTFDETGLYTGLRSISAHEGEEPAYTIEFSPTDEEVFEACATWFNRLRVWLRITTKEAEVESWRKRGEL